MPWWTVGSLMGALGVALGAFGAHGLRSLTEDARLIEIWETAARYHLVHAVAILLVALHPARPAAPAWLFLAGIGVFSGSLYLLALTNLRWLGAITPIGGLCFVAGWVALAFATVQSKG
jgi:uncharacterized membrane protein YgdD (TMEM256/DUF423 family)